MDAIGSRHLYGAGSQDVNNRFVASKLLNGSPLVVPIPDLERTDMLLIVGANRLVSHGSVLTAPRIKDSLRNTMTRRRRPKRLLGSPRPKYAGWRTRWRARKAQPTTDAPAPTEGWSGIAKPRCKRRRRRQFGCAAPTAQRRGA
jgi:hypothetical protein